MSKHAVASVPPLSAEPAPGRRPATTRWLALGLLVVTVAVYAPVRHFGFIKLDDVAYVTRNHHVNAGLTRDGLVWAWTHPHSATWHPLTSVSHMLDCQLFGLNPGPHHLGNVVLHVLNTLLLFGFLTRTTARPWRSACVAGLFALHPLHVESVAWISERKDVLSTCFWMLTLWAYLWYVQGPGARRYALLLAAYAAALLSKPMVVTLPFVLALLDVWPLHRWDGAPTPWTSAAGLRMLPASPAPRIPWTFLVAEKLPLLFMAATVSVITFIVQRHTGASVVAVWPPFTARAANALVSYAAYLTQMLWPSRLAVFYPFAPDLPTWQTVAAALLLITATVLALRERRRHAYLLVGWLWYLVTLTPVIGLLPAGDQAMADRYTYVPLIGIFIMAAWGMPDLLGDWPRRQVACAAAALSVLGPCIVLTSHQLALWRDDTSLFEHALAVTRNNFVAHFCLGLALLDTGHHDEAAAQFSECIRIRPAYAAAHYAMGRLRAADGDLDAAKQEYLEAARLDPADARVYVHLARLGAQQDRLDEAQAWMRRAIDAAPDDPEVHFTLGLLAANAQHWEAAVAAYTTAIRLSPAYAEAHLKLGDALLTLERRGQAIQEYTAAARADPANADAQEHLGVALVMEKRPDEADGAFRQAVKLKPDFAAAYNHWGVALSLQGRFDEAIERYREALRYDPADEDAQFNLHLAEADRAAGRISAAR